MPELRKYIVTAYIEQHPSLKMNMYGFLRKGAVRVAVGIGLEVAEGPTILKNDYRYGLIELWPLVKEG